MRRAVIIGGRGQSGMAIGRRLVGEGWMVTATTSSARPDQADTPGVRWVALERDSGDIAEAVGASTDLVVDVTAFTPAHGDQLIGLGDRIGAAIVVSTLSVYSDSEGRSLDGANGGADFPDWPVPIPEDWPILRPGPDTYSTRKAALEAILRAKAPWPVTIVRPGAIHGPGSHHLREWYFIKRILDRRPAVVLPYSGNSIFQPTATANLAELVALAAAKPGCRTLNCGDEHPPTVARISELIDELMGFTTRRELVDGPEPAPTVGNHPWIVPRPVVADMSSAREELGYRQPVTYAEAIPAALEWVAAACSQRDWRDVLPTLAAYPTDMFDYEAEDAWLEAKVPRPPA